MPRAAPPGVAQAPANVTPLPPPSGRLSPNAPLPPPQGSRYGQPGWEEHWGGKGGHHIPHRHAPYYYPYSYPYYGSFYLYAGLPLYTWWGYYDVFWYPYYPSVYSYLGPAPDQQGTVYSGSEVTVPGVVLEEDALQIEQLSATRVRLSWSAEGRAVQQVSFLVADEGQTVLAVQTLRQPPFTALFETTENARYLGVSVTWEDGSVSTSLVPYRAGTNS